MPWEENPLPPPLLLSDETEDVCINCTDRRPMNCGEICALCYSPGNTCGRCGKPTNGESALCRICRAREAEDRETERQADRLAARLREKLEEMVRTITRELTAEVAKR